MSNSQVRYVSSRIIFNRIAKIFYSTDWREDAKSYLGRGIQILGYNYSTKVNYEDDNNLHTVVNHQVEIPDNVEEISEIHYLGNRLPIHTDKSMLALNSNDDYKWNGIGNYYMIDWPYIKTSFETGDIKIFWKEFRFDPNGFIYIPDNVYYRQALEWYIIYNLMLDGYKTKSKEISLAYAEDKYEENKRKGRNTLKEMSKDRRDRFSKIWNQHNISYNDLDLAR